MTLKKILNLITIFCITILLSNTNLYSQKKSKNSITFDQALHESVEYREIGPFRGGRSAAVVGVNGQPDLYYFGATGGGVWKTVDAGNTWESISDGYFGGSIGALAVSESDPNIIYVGEGEQTLRGNVSSGHGV